MMLGLEVGCGLMCVCIGSLVVPAGEADIKMSASKHVTKKWILCFACTESELSEKMTAYGLHFRARSCSIYFF